MMTDVYVCVSGSYSDYGIDRIFSTRQLADDYVAVRNARPDKWSESQVEVWALDSEPVQYGLVVILYWHHKSDTWQRVESEEDIPTHPEASINEFGVQVKCAPADEARGLKALQDRRAEWLADQAGIS